MALFLYIALGVLVLPLTALHCGFRTALTLAADQFDVHIACTITVLKIIKVKLRARIALHDRDVYFMGRKIKKKQKEKDDKDFSPRDILDMVRDGGIQPRSLIISGGLGVKGDAAASVMLAGGVSCMLDILAAFLGFKSVRIAIRPADCGMNWIKLEGIADISSTHIILAAAKRRFTQKSRKAAKLKCTQ